MSEEDEPGRTRLVELGERPQHRAGDEGARDDERPRSEAVEEPTDERGGQTHRQTAGQEHHARRHRVELEDVLQVDRQEDDRAEHRRHHDDDEPHGERERPGPEHPEVEQGTVTALEDELAPDEEAEAEDADGQCGERLWDRLGRAAAERAEAVDESAEAEGRQRQGHPVERRMALLADVAQAQGADDHHRDRYRQDDPEEEVPGQRVEDEPGQGRAECRGDGHDDGDPAHEATAGVFGHDRHDRRHEQRHHHRRARGLNDAGDDEHGEFGCERTEQGAGCEEAHRQEEHLPCGQALEQVAGRRDDDGHREHERRRRPLGDVERDPEVGDEVRDRHAHDRLVEEGDEGGPEEQPDHPGVRRGRWRRCRRDRLGGVGGLGHAYQTPARRSTTTTRAMTMTMMFMVKFSL